MSFDEDEDDSAPAIRHHLAAHPAFASMVRDITTAADGVPADERYWHISEALDVVEATITASHQNSWDVDSDDERKISPWFHKTRPTLVRKPYGEPYINLADTQAAAAGYLQLKFRVDRLDRLLVDMLIAAEMFTYADTPGIQAELRRILPHPLKWILSNVTTLIGGAAIAAAILWATSGSTVGGWIAAIIFGLSVILSAFSLISFPFYYPQIRKQSAAVRECLTTMRDTYIALDGHPTSVKHLAALIEKAAQAGVVWPSQLYVLMEDIEGRRKAI